MARKTKSGPNKGPDLFNGNYPKETAVKAVTQNKMLLLSITTRILMQYFFL
jgi:hypothetical protein